MTARQQKKIQKWVDQAKPLLGLKDWQIFVEVEPPTDPLWIGMCQDIAGRKLAFLRFGDTFFEDWYTARERTATLIHELLHCVKAQERNFAVNGPIAQAVDESAHRVFEAGYLQVHEYTVDSLACALAPLFPEFQL